MNPRSTIAGLAALAIAPAGLWAQSYRELTFLRDKTSPYASVIQLEAGMLAGFADDQDKDIGLEDKVGWDAHAYMKADRFGDREAVMQAYAGRDGAYFGVLEGGLLGEETQSRLEVDMRYFPFYREGYYRDHDFIPSGRYEGFDWGITLSVAREVSENLRLETGMFYRRNTFDRNGETAFNYLIPDDFNAYGGRMWLEHNTVVLDRVTGRPDHGFLATIGAEREQNDSNAIFGVVGVYESKLPSGVWRGRGHLEWYLPQSKMGTWELIADGELADEDDRVHINDAQKPIGYLWVEGTLGFRFEFDLDLWATPSITAQYVRVVEESGIGNDSEFFMGAGLAAGYDIAENISLLLDYSYLANESRPPVTSSKDTFGEHQLFIGMQATFGAQRKF